MQAGRFAQAFSAAKCLFGRLRADQCCDSRYHGYRPELVEQFTSMGFSLDSVVEALEYCRVDHLLTSLPPARMSDVTTRLLGEQQ